MFIAALPTARLSAYLLLLCVPKVIKETAVFELEEGEWRALGSRTNWDRNKLQEVVPGAA